MAAADSPPGSAMPVRAADPPRGLVGIGIGALVLEMVVVLLATPAVATAERGHVVGWHIGYLLGLVVLLVVALVVLGRLRGGPRGLSVGTAAQLAAIGAGAITWPMYVVGVLFTAIWLYYLNLWRTAAREASG